MLEHRDGTRTEITLQPQDSEVAFSNLPANIAYSLNNFTSEEINENPLACLSAAIREREGMGRSNEVRLLSEEEAKSKISFELKAEDPSKYYDIIERIGVGGFAKVFKVKRKADG